MVRILLLILSIQSILSISCFGSVTIKGNIPDLANSYVSVYKYLDAISFRKEFVATGIFNDSGEINIEFDIVETGYYQIEFLNDYIKIVLSDNGVYEFGSTDEDIKLVSEQNGYNVLLDSINSYVLRTYRTIPRTNESVEVISQAHREVDSLENITIKNIGDNYIRTWIRYRVLFHKANLGIARDPSRISTLSKLEHEYLDEGDVYYDNPGYIDGVRAVLQRRWNSTLFQRTEVDPNEEIINRLISESQYYDRDEIKGMIEILAFYQAYKNQWYENIETVNKALVSYQNSTDDFRTEILNALQAKYNMLKEGDMMPEITLPDMDGKLVSVNSIKKDYILVDFWATWCGICIVDMRKFSELMEEYNENLEIVSISVDENIDDVKKFIEKMDYEWMFLYNGLSRTNIDKLVIEGYPSYFLLDINRKIVYRDNTSESPEEAVERLLGKY